MINKKCTGKQRNYAEQRPERPIRKASSKIRIIPALLRIISLVLCLSCVTACDVNNTSILTSTANTRLPQTFSVAIQGIEHHIAVGGAKFTPEKIDIKLGDVVTWMNQDTIPRTITSMYHFQDEDDTSHIFIGEEWDSGDIMPGESFSRIFDRSGMFEYISLPLRVHIPMDQYFMFEKCGVGIINVDVANEIYKSTLSPTTEKTAITPVHNQGRVVIINSSSYTPEEISIKIGETVTWVNEDLGTRTVTSWKYSEGAEDGPYADIGTVWDSGNIAPGESFSRVFDQAGIFAYRSLPMAIYFNFQGQAQGLIRVIQG